MRKVLVTGGLGYIGSHTVVSLHEAGYIPVVVDNCSTSDLWVKERIELIISTKLKVYEEDVLNNARLLEIARDEQVLGIIHFAAYILVDESVQQPAKYYRNNMLGLLSVAGVCQDLNIPLVFSSSCSVYGNPERLPVSEEEAVKKAESPYANTKKMGEEILRDMSAAGEIRTLCLRYFNPIGAHPSALIGEFQDGVPHHLVPYIVETASGKRKELNVFGSDWDTRDGTCIRDYIHVIDIAEAHIAAMELLVSNPDLRFDVINLGSGTGQTVLEMVHAFENSTGVKVPVRLAPRRPGDVEAVYANNEKAKRILNWQPKRTLEEMLSSAWYFEQKQLEG